MVIEGSFKKRTNYLKGMLRQGRPEMGSCGLGYGLVVRDYS